MLDLNKPMQTRAGWPAKFLHELNTTHRDCLVFAVQPPDQDEELITVAKDGSFFDQDKDEGESDFDVLNVPEKHYVWLTVCDEGNNPYVESVYYAKDAAEMYAKRNKHCVKIIKVEI